MYMFLDREIILEIINQRGLKKSHLIAKTGVSRRTFYKYITGEVEIPAFFVVKLSDCLNVQTVKIVKWKKTQ